MRNGIFIIGIVFAATLAYVVGHRLSNEALAVVVGSLCGISASVPVSIALFIAASRNWGRAEVLSREEAVREYAPREYMTPQPMIALAPPQQFQQPNPFASNQFYLPANAPIEGAPREFKIIAEEQNDSVQSESSPRTARRDPRKTTQRNCAVGAVHIFAFAAAMEFITNAKICARTHG